LGSPECAEKLGDGLGKKGPQPITARSSQDRRLFGFRNRNRYYADRSHSSAIRSAVEGMRWTGQRCARRAARWLIS
jgi:hypothetical protein